MRLPALLILAFSACSLSAEGTGPNSLTEAEKSGGWKLLFDGKTTEGWKSLNGSAFPAKGWEVREGAIHHTSKGGGGDVITGEQFANFELTWEWSVEPGANSGLKYRLAETGKNVGCEYQMIDDDKHPDAKLAEGKRASGALYDVIKPGEGKILKPVGQWNQSRLVVEGTHLQHWLNGVKLVDVDTSSDVFKQAVAASKFKAVKGYADGKPSPILLQDHGDGVSFRSLKIHPLGK